MSTPQASTKFYEQRFVDDFHNELKRKNISLPVTVVLKDSKDNKQIIRNVSGARVLRDKANVKSPTRIKSEEVGKLVTSKADIALYSIAKDGVKVDVAWISHKSNRNKSDKKTYYMQYLDASADVNFKTRRAETKEIKDFKTKMIDLSVQKSSNISCWPKYKDGVSLRIWDYVKSPILMNMVIFGVEYGKEYSRQNANILMVGDPYIEIQDDNTIIFTAAEKNSDNGFAGKSLANGYAEYLPDKDKPIFFTKPTTDAKTTVDKKTIEGVSVWIICRSYAGKNNKMIDDVIDNKDALVSSSCDYVKKEKKIKGTQTNIKHDGYDVYFEDKLENPYAAFYYINNLEKIKKIDYSTIKNNPSYLKVLQKYNKNKIPHGKMINPKTGRFVKGNLVKSISMSTFFKPLRTYTPSKSSTNTSPLTRDISPHRLQNLVLRPSLKSTKSSTPAKSPLPKLLSPTLPTLPTLPKSSSLIKSSSSNKNMSHMNTGFYHISKTNDRQIKSKIFYMPLKKRFYYVAPTTGKPQPIPDIRKYIPENRLKTIIG